LTYKGNPAGYASLTEWLEIKLFPNTGLTAAKCVICPGNHDVAREDAVGLLGYTSDQEIADKALRPERLAGRLAEPFEAFVKFASDLKIPPPFLQKKPNHLAGTLELDGLRFVCLNSAWFCRNSEKDSGRLWLGYPQLHAMNLMDPNDYDSQPITVTLIHHPKDWLADDDKDARNRPASYLYIAERSHIILSGHTHPAIREPDRICNRAHVFVGGAGYHDEKYRNNFSLFRIDPAARTVDRQAWEFDPRGPRWEEKTLRQYSLKGDKPPLSPAIETQYFKDLETKTCAIVDVGRLQGPTDLQPPNIDALFIHLTSVRASKGIEKMEGSERIALEEMLRDERRLVIEGDAGSGKTTFVKWIAWMMCQPGRLALNLRFLAGFPIWIRVSELDEHIANNSPADEADDPRWIAHFLASPPRGFGLTESFYADKLGSEQTVLLLDGLDEAANDERRAEVVKLIVNAAAKCACRIVVTTRPGVDEGEASVKSFGIARIAPLQKTVINNFLWRWCLWLKRGDEFQAQAYNKKLLADVWVPGLKDFRENALMLTMLACLHYRNHRLPEERVELFEQILDWLAFEAVKRHPLENYKKGPMLQRLSRLALGMQEREDGHALPIKMEDAVRLVTRTTESPAGIRRFLHNAQIDSGIITLRDGKIDFWHRTFQEYLAARILATSDDLAARACKLLYSEQGREVLPLVAGRVAESDLERVGPLFQELIASATAQALLERKAHAVGVFGKMMTDLAQFGYMTSGPVKLKFDVLRKSVERIFEKGECEAAKIGLKTRVAAAEALDQANQSRLPLPRSKEYWREICGGEFKIRGDLQALESLPAKTKSIATFMIGKYPVTVWEYYISVQEWHLTLPEDWDTQIKHPGRPVVGVTWDQANEYCEMNGCKLPSDGQWESAARGKDGRLYPWNGNLKPNEYSANFNRMVGTPTPVGLFPDGDTPEGVSDMAGNVWELTCSDHEAGGKIMRGASFGDPGISLRAAYRVRSRFGFKNGFIGFRCVREVIP
jgi:formylglycine-generating enzyme required for sulfatase activity